MSESDANMRGITALAGLCLLVLAGCSSEEQGKVIRAAVTPASPPNLYEENGKTVGLDLELIEGYCKKRGCTIKLTPYDWQGMLGAVVAGQADIAFSGISITDKRKEVMDFSIPYMDNTWNLVSLKNRNIKIDNLDDLKKYSIGYPRGMAYSDFIKNTLEPKGQYKLDQVKVYPSYNEVLADLRNGNLDLAFLDGTVASVYRKTMPIQDSYVFTGFDRFGFAFPKGSKLREDVDKYLTTELKPEERQAIIDKWLK
ncbi:amino acid-binding protein [Camelimonas fluminis]|uniref:Transporter substrate-binding domain-containing protein n=1 Tax=Camelimonas fluminis TaxID=1576911 RepID=A0ABV7UJY6_9HYPH|nr:transporter substrate-binding domain-containing protein [Camelimonas fluminis]GHE53788.1 amino acid-binding protein [Camelimonas fluminis]